MRSGLLTSCTKLELENCDSLYVTIKTIPLKKLEEIYKFFNGL